jgi:hypothetical protein
VKRSPFHLLALALALSGSLSAQIVVLSQSNNPNTITALNSIACATGTLGTPTFTTQENGYFRSYSLAGISGQITIVNVRFAVEQIATTSPSGFPMEIRLYNDANGGTPSPFSGLTLRKTESFSLPVSATNTIVTKTLTGPVTNFSPGETLVVEVRSLLSAVGTFFFIGSNTLGQTAQGYLRASTCGITNPTALNNSALNAPNMHMILDVGYVPIGTGNPYPGTNEDLTMSTGVNANELTTGVGYFVKTVTSGNTAQVKVASTANTFNYEEYVLMAQGFPTGNPPFPPAAPGVVLSISGLTFMIGGPTSPIGPVLLPPGGTTVAFQVPPGLAGTSVIFQGAVVTHTAPLAANGVFATTPGHVFQIQ